MPTPATLPSLALWLDGTQTAYSDAGSTIAAAPFGRVQQIAQPAPLTGNWTASGNARPWRDSNALDFRYYTPGYALGSSLTQPASSAITGNNCTIGLAWENRQGGGYCTLFSAAVGARSIGAYVIGGQLYLANASTLTPVPGISPGIVPGYRIAQCTLIIVCGASQYDIKLTINGAPYTTSVPVTPSSATIGAFVIGANAATQSVMSGSDQVAISQFVVCATALGSTDQTNLQNFLLANGPAGYPVTAPLVAMSGDSICEAWPAGAQTLLDSNDTPPRWLNAGVVGAHQTFPDQIPSYYTTDILPRYSSARAKNIIVCEGISVNDIAYRIAQGDSVSVAAATVLAAYYAYCDRAKADGWIVIVCTLTPNRGGATYDAIRAIVNPDIRTNWAAHGAFLADLGATAGMATSADAANTTYFLDGTHPTVAGYVLLDGTLLPVITAALASTPVLPTTDLSNTLTYDQTPWHRPGIDELGGGSLPNLTPVRDPRTVPDARMFNQLTRLIVASASLVPSARVQVEFPAGVATVTAVVGLNTLLVPADFTVTVNAAGDTSLTIAKYVGEQLRPCGLTIAEDVEIDRARVFPVANGWRVKTKLGATGTNAAFVLELHAPAQH